MFNYGNANEAQKEAISATDGLVLITAGPGTGKTFTLVKRAVYLIQECGIKPEQIMMATFTEKAAKELITRITNELAERNVSVNVNEMYIGTFHSLCLRIIKENLEFTRLKRNYRLLDTFDQKYLVFRNFHKFKNIEGIDELLSKGGSWKRSDEICTYINHLSEEMVDIEALQSDDNPGIRTLGRVLSVYQEMLEEGNLIDFSTIQTECYKLLMQNKQILEELQDKLQYLMIDEYQDTNYIQEQIVFLLGAKHHNICVVGDDDQGLYRFRGATIRNILEFPHKFENEGCKIIPLVVNYRSNSDIVDFYNEWISTTSGHKFKFSWDIYRYQKKIEPHVKSDIQSPAVVKLFSKDDEDEWHEKILGFIKELKESGKLTDYNQLAFLFSSVKHQRVTALANFLERNGINVYSPRSDMFFKRDEIKLALGCLMLMFPKYVMKLVEKGREGWNCRSLLGIALFRSPKSKVFVLQATMRCLRQLTKEQLKATIFLSKENYDTLDDELRKNYNMEISDFGKSPNTNKKVYKVRVLPPPRSIKMKRLWHEYSLIEKEYSVPIDFHLAELDESKYETKMYEKGSLRLGLSEKETNIDSMKEQERFSEFSLTAEISRYMNISCLTIAKILRESVDGSGNIVAAVNRHNEILEDVIIPEIFHTLYEVKSTQKSEDVDMVLLREPKDSGYYEFSANDELVITKGHNNFTPKEEAKSFHADTYCFDSKPEKECFLQYISSNKVKEIYFTGMFTSNQGDLSVQYYDPESKRLRKYYPDFLALMEDGSYQLIEVKGDNKIDDEVVLAKKAAAEEMAVASGVHYLMYAGSTLMKSNVLEPTLAVQQTSIDI